MRVTKEKKRDSASKENYLNVLFSKKIKDNLTPNGFHSIEELSEHLGKNEVTIPKATIDTYKGDVPKSPSLYKASAISKALNFSLDELRDSIFSFSAPDETVDGKLMGYYQLYCTVVKIFPKLANYELYNDIPIFVEFLNKIDGLENTDSINAVAKMFNELYFIQDSVIVEKKKYIEETKQAFVKRWMNIYLSCNGSDKKTMIEEHFNKLVERYPDMNDFNLNVRLYDFNMSARSIDKETLNILKKCPEIAEKMDELELKQIL